MKNRVARVLAVLLAVVMAVSSLPFYGTSAKAAVKAQLVKTSASIVIGQKVKIKSIVPKGASVSYQSADKKTASVSAKGKVTGIRAGKTKITVTVKEGKSKKKLIYKVNVKKPKISKKTQNILKGKSIKISVKNKPKKAKYTWSSSNKKVAAVTKKGKVTGKKNGTAVIKVKCFSGKKFSYTLSCKVKVAENSAGSHELSIEVENELADIDSETDVIVTQEEQLLLKGKVTGNDTVEKMEVTYSDYTEEEKKADVTGTTDWSVKIPLEIGTNIVQIIAKGTYTGDVKKKVIINRTNKTITYNENVKIAEEKEYKQLEDGITACWVDANGTEDASDDKIILLVKEDSLLLQQIRDGKLQRGDVYMLPQSETFVTGFTAVYEKHQAFRGTEAYPAENYPDNAFEEVIFTYPSYADILSEDVSLDFSEIDEENPIAFAMYPDGTPMDVKVETSKQKTRNTGRKMTGSKVNHHGAPFSDGYVMSLNEEDEDYKEPGWRLGDAAADIMHEVEFSKVWNLSDKCLNLTFDFQDIVLYDKDGKKDTEYDQLKLDGKFGIENLENENGFEWHPEKFKVLPSQLKNKITYDFVGEYTLKGEITEEISSVNKESDFYFVNKNVLANAVVLSGVDTFSSDDGDPVSNKAIIGSIGIHLSKKKIPVYGRGMDNVVIESRSSLLSPMLVLYLFIDMNGHITLEGSMTYSYKTSFTKGFNLQRNGYVGSYGTQDENKGDLHYDISDYTLDVYDGKEQSSSVSFKGKVEADFDLGAGLGAGLMLFGICPVTAYGEAFLRLKGSAESNTTGTCQILPKPNIGIDSNSSIFVYTGIGVKADVDCRIMLRKKGGDDFEPDLKLEKEIDPWEKMLFEQSLCWARFNGHSYEMSLGFALGCSWEDARKNCEREKGHLLTINSEEEQKFIENLLEKAGARNSYWLGGRKDETGVWQWITGEPFVYSNWADGQPDSFIPDKASGEENALMMYCNRNPKNPAPLGKWNDISEDGTCGDEEFFGADNFGYICEWDYLK